MSFWEKVAGEFVDIIEIPDNPDEHVSMRFERYGNEIKNGATLTVREGQVAIFVSEGRIADKFDPGMYSVETENLPVLSTLRGWAQGFRSPFKAEVYFLDQRLINQLFWGTPAPVFVIEPSSQLQIEVTARGSISVKVADPEHFLRRVVGSKNFFSRRMLEDLLRTRIVAHVVEAIAESNISIFEMTRHFDEISSIAKEYCNAEFLSDFGIVVEHLTLQAVSLPEPYKEMVQDVVRTKMLSGQLDAYQAVAQADALKAMANNPQGTGMLGMGVGLSMAQNYQGGNPSGPAAPAGYGSSPPPPPPQAQYYVYNDGQQFGPFSLERLGP